MQFHDMTLGFAALMGVLALIWLSQRGVSRLHAMRGSSSGGRLRFVQSLAIDPKRRLVLLQCDGRDILVLVGGAQDLVLPHPPMPAGEGT